MRQILLLGLLLCSVSPVLAADSDLNAEDSVIKDSLLAFPRTYREKPIGFREKPLTYLELPRGFRENPLGWVQLPKGFREKPLGYVELPVKLNPPGFIEKDSHLLANNDPAKKLSQTDHPSANNDPMLRVKQEENPKIKQIQAKT